MPRPRLIHPVWCVIERHAEDERVMDDQAREPVHGLRTTDAQTYRLPAQVAWTAKADPDSEVGGVRAMDTGYILCRPVDLDSILGTGERLKMNDRIISLGVREGLDLYLTGKEQPLGHYPDQDGQSLIRYYFEGRRPVRSSDAVPVFEAPAVTPTPLAGQTFDFIWPADGPSAVVVFDTAMSDATYSVTATVTDANGGLTADLRVVSGTKTKGQMILATTEDEALTAGATIEVTLTDE